MKYKFIFAKTNAFGKTTYEIERESYSRTKEEMFHDACCLLDFCIFDEVRMFDESGKELTELY